MTSDAKSIAVGVFLALVAYKLFEMLWREVEGSIQLPVLILLIALVALAIFAFSKRRRPRRR